MERATTIMFCGGIMLLCYIIILGLILCDLRAGVRKAKERGEYRTSAGFKRTIDKIARYFNMTFAMSLVDVMQITLLWFVYRFYGYDLVMIPWLTLFALGYVAWVEIHSIWEPANVKEKAQQEEYRKMLFAVLEEYGSVEKLFEVLKATGRPGGDAAGTVAEAEADATGTEV